MCYTLLSRGKGGGLVYIFIVSLFAEPKVKPGEERRGLVRNCDGAEHCIYYFTRWNSDKCSQINLLNKRSEERLRLSAGSTGEQSHSSKS